MCFFPLGEDDENGSDRCARCIMQGIPCVRDCPYRFVNDSSSYLPPSDSAPSSGEIFADDQVWVAQPPRGMLFPSPLLEVLNKF
jgi:hypothetical protein